MYEAFGSPLKQPSRRPAAAASPLTAGGNTNNSTALHTFGAGQQPRPAGGSTAPGTPEPHGGVDETYLRERLLRSWLQDGSVTSSLTSQAVAGASAAVAAGALARPGTGLRAQPATGSLVPLEKCLRQLSILKFIAKRLYRPGKCLRRVRRYIPLIFVTSLVHRSTPRRTCPGGHSAERCAGAGDCRDCLAAHASGTGKGSGAGAYGGRIRNGPSNILWCQCPAVPRHNARLCGVDSRCAVTVPAYCASLFLDSGHRPICMSSVTL